MTQQVTRGFCAGGSWWVDRDGPLWTQPQEKLVSCCQEWSVLPKSCQKLHLQKQRAVLSWENLWAGFSSPLSSRMKEALVISQKFQLPALFPTAICTPAPRKEPGPNSLQDWTVFFFSFFFKAFPSLQRVLGFSVEGWRKHRSSQGIEENLWWRVAVHLKGFLG